ncbi:MAG: tRNA preQ1(34) S-adenosylmethionine ribosyltransferase-isomerase QueA [Pseudomonadota bacterium]|jgi:S-adenosylmethionine:tRNA ribosyltransferase-isomerase
MQLADFDFHLPEDRIALRPARPRDSARLLDASAGSGLADRQVRDLPDLLRAGDVLVFNDTKVIPARLFGERHREESVVSVEATLHRRRAPDVWDAFMKPGKRLKPGDRVRFGEATEGACLTSGIEATVQEKDDSGIVTLHFDLAGPALDEAVMALGTMPLPPYIAAKRAEDEADRQDYQTVYARLEGSVAAPTAGLHFTPDLLAKLEAKGVGREFVTLHVGAGTFLPVKTDTIAEHRMHAEYGEVSAEVAERLNTVKRTGGRIICVGTTSLRLLESAVDEAGVLRPFAAETDIFITPGHRFRTADLLLTNFHLPRSTLIMLVAAFSGLELVRNAYQHALDMNYRFYSYGDAGLFPRIETAE